MSRSIRRPDTSRTDSNSDTASARWVLGMGAILAFALLCASAGQVHADEPADKAAAALRASYVSLQPKLKQNQFDRPLALQSSEGVGKVSGYIHAVINAPFDAASAALASPEDWCGILNLLISTKDCKTSRDGQARALNIWVGTSPKQALENASRLTLAFNVHAKSANYLRMGLNSIDGPMGTRDILFKLEAIPLDGERTFVHFSYAYGFGSVGRLAILAYLATFGRDKVGFTLMEARTGETGSAPQYIAGQRGIVERNTMRYYLAVEAYLGAMSLPPQVRFEKRIRDWYAGAGRYRRQLYDMELQEYLDMKRAEYRREARPPS